MASFRFLVFQSSNKPKQTIQGQTKHLEAEEFKGNTNILSSDLQCFSDQEVDRINIGLSNGMC